ncbi:tetratricopeptide repeat protein [Streptomyces boluensis]|uniref:Tetratricopeptide repeat protein n=1 Tax=Streptomyces boluensis TaxID=1775135 RepID=A0A964UXU3_9ACTN|nr:tetratricopeptide repeat protein [Streptomyces boluensis]NBE53550.1 tetratricopeptide repeat protein [Streptomyces boluensis]
MANDQDPQTRRRTRRQTRRRAARRGSSAGRALLTSVAGAAVLAGVISVVPLLQKKAPPPAPGPVGRATAATGAGVPASLPDLAALIGEREAHVSRHPGDDESWAVLGAAYVEKGRRTADLEYYAKADDALKRSLAALPGGRGNVEGLAGMALLAGARHDWRAAKKWGEQAVAKAPERWTLYPPLIDAYGGLGDDKAVGKALEKLQELRSGSAVMARTSQVYRDRGWREDSAAYLSDAAALAKTPAEQATYQHRFGELAFERGEAAQALRYFEAALRTDPEHYISLAGKGRALRALGRTPEALAAYQAAVAKLPLPELSLELGELYESLGMEPASRAQYDLLRARVRAEGTVGVNDALVLGRFEADHDVPQAAVVRLVAEFKRQPGREASDALGWALYRAGDSKRALWYAKRAMKDGPRSALFAYHRGQIERELGQSGPARRHLQEALRINPHFSPLLAPYAIEALDALGEPPEGGPANMHGEPSEKPTTGPSPTPPRAPAARPRTTTTPTPKPTPTPTKSSPSGGTSQR